jgi:hypothetical protein
MISPKLLVLLVAVSCYGQSWEREEKTDPLRGTSQTQFTLRGKYLQAPRIQANREPLIVVRCAGGRFADAYIRAEAILDAEPQIGVLVKYRIDDGSKLIAQFWPRSTDFQAVFFKSNVLATFLAAHKIVVEVSEYLGSTVVMQFDVPSGVEVAESCGLVIHTEKKSAALVGAADSARVPPTTTPTNSGPFGLEFGMTREQIVKLVGQDAVKHLKDEPDDVLKLSTAPTPHPDFAEYSLIISPERGLVCITASGKAIQTTRYGEGLKAAFTEIRDALSRTYGAPTVTFDFLEPGSLRNEPQDWMTGLLKNERELISLWNFKIPYPKHITSIFLKATALSMDEGTLELTYPFEGFIEDANSKKAKAGSVF